jgi:hypothetical protein
MEHVGRDKDLLDNPVNASQVQEMHGIGGRALGSAPARNTVQRGEAGTRELKKGITLLWRIQCPPEESVLKLFVRVAIWKV